MLGKANSINVTLFSQIAFLEVTKMRRILGLQRWASRFSILPFALSVLCLSPLAQPGFAAPHPDEKPVTEPDWNVIPTAKSDLWEVSQFGGEGDVTFGKDSIVMDAGDPLTGVRCTADIPREMFEIELEARRLTNFDFFCGLTFPVGEGQCSLILGGWAGSVVGLSSIDGADAARNATKKLMHFENEKWYRVRVRVDRNNIHCWIDDQKVVDQPRGNHKFDIRVEMDPCTPVGVAAFQCESEFRNFRWRKLDDSKVD